MMSLEAVMLSGATTAPSSPCMLSHRPHSSKTMLASQSCKSRQQRMRVLSVSAVAAVPAPPPAAAAAGIPRQSVKEVSLASEVGVNYEELRTLLAGGEWEAADAETRRLICVLAGEGAVKRQWVFFSEVQFIPQEDLRTVDGLWKAYSGGKFGYSVQRRLWKNVDKSWTRYFAKVGWTRPLVDSRNSAYKKFPLEFSWDVADPTPIGHLPLTNALRGTQLLEKLLEHPALDFVDEEEDNLLLPDTDGVVLQSSPNQQQQPQPPTKQPAPQSRVVIPDEMTVDYGF